MMIPVVVVSGTNGVGKSTLIENLSKSLRLRNAVAISDDGENDLFQEIETAVSSGAGVIFIECAPNLEPFFVAEHLSDGDEEGPPPVGVYVDALVTVLEAPSLLKNLTENIDLSDLDLAFDEEDDRMLSELLMEQIEFSNVLVLSKVDRISHERADQLEALLRRLNPHAQIERAEFGQTKELAREIGTGLFDFDHTEESAGWLAELSGDFEDEGKENGVSSFTYIERRPFHPIRFNEFLNDIQMDGLIRAKGYVWVASRHHEIGVWSLAGKASLLTYGGAWFAATPAREWPKDGTERAEIMRDWVPPFGDRRQEIAFIGLNMNEIEIRERLRECLLTSQEMKDGPDGWFSLPDPLPDWHTDTDPESYM